MLEDLSHESDPGTLIRSERTKRKLSQAKLSKLLGIQQYRLSAWELSKEFPSPEDLKAISAVLRKVDDDISAGNVSLFKKRYKPKGFILFNDSSQDGGERRTIEVNQRIPTSKNDYCDLLLDLEKTPTVPSLTAIALFAGCGGMSLGFKWAGFNVVGHVEIDDAARHTYSLNFPSSVCLGTDVCALTDSEISKWKETFGEIRVLFGGPPCQGFSLAGKRDRHDPRNQLYGQFARIAGLLKPEVVLLENVRLMTSMRTAHGQDLPSSIVSAFDQVGYAMAYQPLNAQDFGVPQFRERVFFIGVRSDLPCSSEIRFPQKTHGNVSGEQLLFAPSLNAVRTFRNATCDLEPLESGEKSANDSLHFAVEHPAHVVQMLQGVPEGASAHNNPDPHLRPPSGYNTTYKRLRWDEPCSTIGTNFGMISGCRNVHPQDTRSLTVREALRSQSFPDTFRFDLTTLTIGDVRRVIGNAVPPLLANVLAQYLRQSFIDRVSETERAS
jgi:DNA (cytosine-5)-methyltransferase 1